MIGGGMITLERAEVIIYRSEEVAEPSSGTRSATLLEDASYQRAAMHVAPGVGLALIGTFGGFAAARELLALSETA